MLLHCGRDVGSMQSLSKNDEEWTYVTESSCDVFVYMWILIRPSDRQGRLSRFIVHISSPQRALCYDYREVRVRYRIMTLCLSQHTMSCTWWDLRLKGESSFALKRFSMHISIVFLQLWFFQTSIIEPGFQFLIP